VNSNLRRFKALDDAYNARDWEAYGSFIDEEFRGRMLGKTKPEGKVDHVRGAEEFCASAPDNQVHNAPYIVALEAGEWTCTIARLTGTTLAPSDGEELAPTSHPFETSFATFARWTNGKIVEEYEFLDVAGIVRQMEGTK
jgi:predicted ester cyclase